LWVAGATATFFGMSAGAQRFELLSSRDWELIARLSERIHYINANEPFLNHAFVVLNDAIPNNFFSVESYSINPVSFEQAVNVGFTGEQLATHQRYLHQHPLVKHFMTVGVYSVGTILSVTTPDEFHKTDLYQNFYAFLGVEDQLIYTLPHPGGVYVLAYSRDTPFIEKEVLIMELLKPQLHIALRDWQCACELEQFRRTLQEKSPETGLDRDAQRFLARLSPRQLAVAEQVARGLENRQIAEVLHISPKTVGKHLENIFEILGIHHRAALAAIWERSDR
jgi:DNA-binding CsgD family transcriptional regulator